ncbi:MAG: M14 family zinc carboxypeptidase [Rhodoferax sp.]
MNLPELDTLERVLELGGAQLQTRVVHWVELRAGLRLPVYAIALGNPSASVPVAGFFGGVHGLERIGAEVVIAHLHSVVMRLQWDRCLHRQLEDVRLVFMPIVNPGGMALGTRANPQGVDLMRNAPLDATGEVPPLVGGHHLGPYLPWYRGLRGAPMQPEAQALCAVVQEELLSRPFAVALDCHSGFGMRDRLWFPYAHTRRPIAHLAEMQALCALFFQTYSHHNYLFEPQSAQYLAHGDLWDHLYRQSLQGAQGRVFLPLTLEMGSWLWVKKNPRQLFSRHGIFNPLISHRQQRVLRRHQLLLDFFARAAAGYPLWQPTPAQRPLWHEQALQRWY